MANIENPNTAFVDLFNDSDISYVSSRSEVINLETWEIFFLDVRYPFVRFIEFRDYFDYVMGLGVVVIVESETTPLGIDIKEVVYCFSLHGWTKGTSLY